jgi:hypothetical protein
LAVITDYPTLATAVGDYLERSDLSTFIPNFIQACEKKLYRSIKIRGIEADFNVAIATSVVALPSDYREAKHLYVDGSPSHPLGRMNLKNLLASYPRSATTGLPDFYARQGDNLIFGPMPDSNYTIKGVYYKKLPSLAEAGSGSNYFTTNAPEVLLYGSLIEAEAFVKNDPRIGIWKGQFSEAVGLLVDESDEEEVSGDAPFEVLA